MNMNGTEMRLEAQMIADFMSEITRAFSSKKNLRSRRLKQKLTFALHSISLASRITVEFEMISFVICLFIQRRLSLMATVPLESNDRFTL